MSTSVDQTEFISVHEFGRFLRWRAQFLRNRIYWRELRKLQCQGFDDAIFLVTHLRGKVSLMKRVNELWQSSTASTSSSTATSLTYHTIGDSIVRTLIETDEAQLKAHQDLVDAIERQILPVAREKLTQHEKSASVLWEKGKILLIAWMIQDQIVSTLYQLLPTTTTSAASPRTSNKSRSDLWINLVRYYQATNKLKQVTELCNKHFHTLFLIAKDLENARLSLVVRIAEQYLSKMMEMTQQFGVSAKSTTDGIKGLPISISNTQRSLAEELERRVREESSEGGKFDALAAYQLQQREAALSSMNLSAYGVGWDGGVPSIHDLLRCASLRRIFIFSREEPGYVSSTWIPILVAVTADGWLHLIKMIETDTSTSYSTTNTTVMPIAVAFELAVNSYKQCFEEDINEPVDPNVISLEKKMTLKNASFAKLCDSLSLDDLDAGRDEVWSHAIETFLNDSANSSALNGVDTFLSMDLRHCTSVLIPSAVASENIVEITETVETAGSIFSFSRTTERKVALKARLQPDAIELMSLLQTARAILGYSIFRHNYKLVLINFIQMSAKAEREAVVDFAKYVDLRVRVRIQGGREVEGVLRGYDKLDNLVLDDTIEYMRDPKDLSQVTYRTRQLGQVVVRGTQISLICPSDEMQEIANPFEAADDAEA